LIKRISGIVLLVIFLSGVGMAGGQDKIKIFDAKFGKVIEVDKVIKSDDEWKHILTPEQYRVMRRKGTEEPFQIKCPLPPKDKNGIYQCVACGTDLFRYYAKFESGTGWPSFWEPVSELNVRLKPDDSLGMKRTEILCARCDAHLGHVFDDGPLPAGKRYCINAIVLKLADMPLREKAAFAAGCFWGAEAAFGQIPGVVSTLVGYMGGVTKNPTYEEVCGNKTGHAETVLIEYDPDKVAYNYLLDFFFNLHDPTTANRQGPDIGSQYRSVIFYYTQEQKELATAFKKKLQDSKKFKSPILTEIIPAGEFYKAEDYHQKYFDKKGIKPTCYIPLRKVDKI